MPGPNTNKKAEAAIRKRRARELHRMELTAACIAKRRHNIPYAQIAKELSDEGWVTETGKRLNKANVYQIVVNGLRNRDDDDVVYDQEIDRLETAAAKLLAKMEDMEALPEGLIDLEVYAKLSDTYLKYRDRVAKLRGLDRGGVQGGTKAQKAQQQAQPKPGEASSQHLHLHLPNSVNAFEEWQKLTEHGLTQLAHEVLELEAAAEPDPLITGMHNDAAGSTLAPAADITPGAERIKEQKEPANSLEALEALGRGR